MSDTSTTDFGSCWSCVTDLTMPSSQAGGQRAIAEAIARRLQTPRGRNVGDPNYGYDVTAFLDADLSQADVVLMQGQVDAECVKDERVLTAACTASLTGTVLVISVALTTASGPFTLVLGVSAVTVTILAPTQ